VSRRHSVGIESIPRPATGGHPTGSVFANLSLSGCPAKTIRLTVFAPGASVSVNDHHHPGDVFTTQVKGGGAMSEELTESGESSTNGEGEGQDRPTGLLGRRALMLGAVTGVGAAVALVAGATPAFAGNGTGADVQLDESNAEGNSTATAITTTFGDGLVVTTSQDSATAVQATSSGEGGTGVVGTDSASSTPGTGVFGSSQIGQGVWGMSQSYAGVQGSAGFRSGLGMVVIADGAGVWGDSSSGLGVVGTSSDNLGVYGIAGDESGILESPVAGVMGDSGPHPGVVGTSSMENGVYGVSVAASNVEPGVVAGVWGDSTTHAGVVGTSSDSVGVAGYTKATGQAGVLGADESASGGIGVQATSTHGTALEVGGKATFTRSGVATLSAAATSVTVTVAGGLTSTSHVLATLQTDTGTIAVRAAVPDASNGKVTIYFTASAPKNTKVAWFVFG
jgi:hypothetical protein